MRNPIITESRVAKMACPQGKRAFRRHFGKGARITLKKGLQVLAAKGTFAALSDGGWGITVFGRPTKADAEVVLRALSIPKTPSRVRYYARALISYLKRDPEDSWGWVLEQAFFAQPEQTIAALFPESFKR